jgi:hypothetical protein
MSLRDLQDLAGDRHAHEPLLDRVLDLRDAASAYDAVYVARRTAGSLPGHR